MNDSKLLSPATIIVVFAVLVLAAIVGIYLVRNSDVADSGPIPVAVAPAQPVKEIAPPPPPDPEPLIEPEPAVATPVVETKPEKPAIPLPSLDESDGEVVATLENQPNIAWSRILGVDNHIRKFVRAVMAMEEGVVVKDYRPIQSPVPGFQVEKTGAVESEEANQQYRIAASNYARYDAYINALENVDKDTLVALYQRLYPLLDQAYQSQGVDRGSFHKVMLTVIDDLLAAPDIDGEIILKRPKVFYEFADPELEALPEPDKLMLRIGPERAQMVKDSLRELKAKLTAKMQK